MDGEKYLKRESEGWSEIYEEIERVIEGKKYLKRESDVWKEIYEKRE